MWNEPGNCYTLEINGKDARQIVTVETQELLVTPACHASSLGYHLLG